MAADDSYPLSSDGPPSPLSRVWPCLLLLAAISFLLAPFSCYWPDTYDFLLRWASVTANGTRPWAMYLFVDKSTRCQYPPVVSYLLAGAEYLRNRFGLLYHSPGMLLLIKLPNILSQVVGAWLCGRLLLPLSDRPAAARSVILYATCTALFVNAAWWGQYDTLLSMPMVAAALLLAGRHYRAAGACFGVAMAIKLQAVILLPPLVVFSLRDNRTDPTSSIRRRLKPLVVAALAASVAWILLALPDLIGGGAVGIKDTYFNAVDRYPFLSIFAPNIWQLVIQYRISVGHLSASFCPPDNVPFLLSLTAKTVGLALLGPYLVGLLVVLWMRPFRYEFILASTLFCMGFFMLPTQMHERYIVPAVAIAIPLAAVGGRGERIFYFGIMATATLSQGLRIGLVNWAIGHRSTPLETLEQIDRWTLLTLSVANVALFIWGSWLLVNSPHRRRSHSRLVEA